MRYLLVQRASGKKNEVPPFLSSQNARRLEREPCRLYCQRLLRKLGRPLDRIFRNIDKVHFAAKSNNGQQTVSTILDP